MLVAYPYLVMTLNEARDVMENLTGMSLDDLNALLRTVSGEAANQSLEGKKAVVHVVFNRLKRKKARWGRTIAEVCRKPKQFSCWNEGDPNRKRILDLSPLAPEYGDCLRAILERGDDSTDGATHYHTASILPYWAAAKYADRMVRRCQIGDHIFYREA